MVNIHVGKVCLRIFQLELSEHVHDDGEMFTVRGHDTNCAAPLRVSAIYIPPAARDAPLSAGAQVADVIISPECADTQPSGLWSSIHRQEIRRVACEVSKFVTPEN